MTMWVLKPLFLSYLSFHLKPSGSGYQRSLKQRCVYRKQKSHWVTLWPVASNVFSMQGAAQPTVEGTQLGLEQGPVRKTPPLIETTQISLSDPCFYSKRRGGGLLQTINVSYWNAALFGTSWLYMTCLTFSLCLWFESLLGSVQKWI